MATKGNTMQTALLCTVCNKMNYQTLRNKKNTPKLELKKHCSQCRKHTLHKSKDIKSSNK